MNGASTVGMVCPSCQVDLQLSERHGIEIDYCPRCRGVWLDRGELDKIIDRAASTTPPPRYEDRGAPRYEDRRDDDWDERNRRRRKGGFLGELFDFD